MEGPVFYILDVFAEEKYTGNQLAVFRNTGELTDNDMQDIAREMNYSETTFITSEDEKQGGYDVRIFTPKTELPFAGHPTLGTAYIIQKEIIKKPVDTVTLNLPVGQIPVSITYKDNQADELWMKQVQPKFGEICEKNNFTEILGLNPDDIHDKFPIEEVSTGFFTFIVPLRTLDAVQKSRVNVKKFFNYSESMQAKVILVFTPETYTADNDLNVRFFADYLGIVEDPATGSANGCLAAYLVKHRYFGSNRIDIRIEQGIEIERPSLLLLRAQEDTDSIDINVGGRVQLIARGEFV